MPTSAAESSTESVRRILEEGQPWYPVHRLGGEWATVLFDPEESEDAEALAAELRERGFDARIHHAVALSRFVPEMLHLAIDGTEKWMAGEILRGTVPAALTWLMERLRKVTGGAVHPHPALLYQQRVRPWLDARFGQGAWRYDPDSVEFCSLGGHVAFALVEENTNAEVVLCVHGLTGEIGEVSFSRRVDRDRRTDMSS